VDKERNNNKEGLPMIVALTAAVNNRAKRRSYTFYDILT
jgi:hypothetical protein